MNEQIVVLWNGTRASSSGMRYLVATEEPEPPPEAYRVSSPWNTRQQNSLDERVMASIRKQPRTRRDLTMALDGNTETIALSLQRLKARGLIHVTGHVVAQKGKYMEVWDVCKEAV